MAHLDNVLKEMGIALEPLHLKLQNRSKEFMASHDDLLKKANYGEITIEEFKQGLLKEHSELNADHEKTRIRIKEYLGEMLNMLSSSEADILERSEEFGKLINL